MLHRISLAEHSDKWQRAVERAIANECEAKVTHVCTEYAPDLGWESVFAVRSNSVDGQRYLVQLVVEADERTATCSCPAGSNGVICWHAAACALIAGMLTQAAPVDALIVDEVPDDMPKKLEPAGADLAFVFGGQYRHDLAAGLLG